MSIKYCLLLVAVSNPSIAISVGDSAKNAFHSNPPNTVFDAKRLIGRSFDEPEVQKDMKHW